MEQPNPLLSPSPGNLQANSEGESQDVTSQDSFQFNQLTPNNQAQLDFILIRQKDNILKEINFGNPSVAMAKLKLVKELWENTEYLYKYEELLTKLEHKIKSRLSHC
jgi:chaperonin cofactor prefoldin